MRMKRSSRTFDTFDPLRSLSSSYTIDPQAISICFIYSLILFYFYFLYIFFHGKSDLALALAPAKKDHQ